MITKPGMEHSPRSAAALNCCDRVYVPCRKLFFIIDALDECPKSTRDILLSEIRKLPPKVHILVTSRHVSVEREFDQAVSVEIRVSDGNIRRRLKSRIKREGQLALLEENPILREPAISAIIEEQSEN